MNTTLDDPSHAEPIRLYWWRRVPNFGDALNPWLITKLTGRPVRWSRSAHSDVLAACGSIVSHARPGWTVWGSGIMDPKYPVADNVTFTAVRGPRTYECLRRLGRELPEIFGDPALLLPLVHPAPAREPDYDWAFIPHYTDRFHRTRWAACNSVPFFSCRNPASDTRPRVLYVNPKWSVNRYLNAVFRCRGVLSSSLHGVVIGEAYRKPTVWISLNNRLAGGRFKFYDFFEAVGKTDERPLIVTSHFDWNAIDAHRREWRPITWNAALLLKAFPLGTCDIAHMVLN